MAAEWALPAAAELYKNRKEIFSVWDRILTFALGPKSKIAFVGPAGVGKSVLLDHISGKAFTPKYKKPVKSATKETGGASADGKRLAMIVSPGQGGPKYDTYAEVFDPKSPVDGVVFVAGAGFITLRDARAEKINVARGADTIAKWRKMQRDAELIELQELTVMLRKLLRESRKPSWLMVAATKADLYFDNIEIEKDYYSPHGHSAFTKALNELVSKVGADNFEWEAAPVCSALDEFKWNGETAASQLSRAARDHFLASFVESLGALCR